MSRVERGQPHEPVHPLLRREEPVRVLARRAERRRLDARFLALARLQELDLELPALRPAHQHAQHHLGPVLRVGAARARIDADQGVPDVVGACEEALLLQLGQLVLDRGHVLVHLAGQRGVLCRKLGQPRQLFNVGLQRLEGVQPARRTRVLGRDPRGSLGVVPEARRPHLGLERGDALRQRSGVKGSPRAASAGRGSPQGAAAWAPKRRWSPCVQASGPPRPVAGARYRDGGLQAAASAPPAPGRRPSSSDSFASSRWPKRSSKSARTASRCDSEASSSFARPSSVNTA